ncbi:MAG: hypothetical protein AAFR38_13995 [Planctomycetota bacterium]
MDGAATNEMTPGDRRILRGRCFDCGYELRGLKTDGGCPECGAAIADSRLGPLFRENPIAFGRRLARAISNAHRAIILLFVSWFALFAIGALIAAFTPAATVLRLLPMVAMPLAMIGCLIWFLRGWFMFATLPPNGAIGGETDTARQRTRASAQICLIALGSVIAIHTLQASVGTPQGMLAWAWSAAAIVLWLVGLIGIIRLFIEGSSYREAGRR